MTDTKTLRAVRYLRCSTDGQDLGAQQDATSKYVDFRGWTDLGERADFAASAKDLKRPEFLAVRELLRAGEVDVLVAQKLDRISRSVSDFSGLMLDAQQEGWAIAVCDLDLDTTTPNGRMVAHIIASIAQWEREMIGLRTKEALQALKRRGVRLGRRLTISQADLARLFEMREAGATQKAIGEALGIPRSNVQWHLKAQVKRDVLKEALSKSA